MDPTWRPVDGITDNEHRFSVLHTTTSHPVTRVGVGLPARRGGVAGGHGEYAISNEHSAIEQPTG
jgi:hypothetical protein